MFEFAVGLLLLDVMPNTLALAATYNFVRSSTLILCGSSAGSIVDQYKRINGMFAAKMKRVIHCSSCLRLSATVSLPVWVCLVRAFLVSSCFRRS
jgi:hypothetical protein